MRFIYPSILLVSLLITYPPASAQDLVTDDLVNKACKCFESLPELKENKLTFSLAYEDCFKEVYGKTIVYPSPEGMNDYLNVFFESLQKICPQYKEIVEISDQLTQTKSVSRVKDLKACDMVRTGRFEEPFGGESIVIMQDSIQIIEFTRDKTYTRSRVNWISPCEYELVFIESTNSFENSMVKTRDSRKFRIIGIEDNEIIYEYQMVGRWFIGRMIKVN